MNILRNKFIKINYWPFGNTATFCISFDDYSPFYFAGYDLGGNLKGELIAQQNFLLANSKVKITHFVVPQTNFFLPLNHKIHNVVNFETDKYALNNKNNSKWLEYVKDLISDNRVEIGMHGLRQFNNHFRKKHQEFLYDDYNKIKNKILSAYKIFQNVNIPIYGFRQPGWGIDKNESLIEVINDLNSFEYIAASSLNAGLNKDQQRVDNYMPSWYKNLLNIPQNLELDTNLEKLFGEIDEIVKNNKLISLKGHFTNIKWITNNFNKINFEKLKRLLEYISHYKIWYATFKEVSDYFQAINSAVIKESLTASGSKLYQIKTNKRIIGLTVTIELEANKPIEKEIVSDDKKVILNINQNTRIIFNSLADNFILEIV